MPPVLGVVLETFGAGNAPQRADLMQSLKDACDRGVVVVAISQCSKGSVSDAYETGRTLLQAGVVAGGDMTPEVSRQLIRSSVLCWSSLLWITVLLVCTHKAGLSSFETGTLPCRNPRPNKDPTARRTDDFLRLNPKPTDGCSKPRKYTGPPFPIRSSLASPVSSP